MGKMGKTFLKSGKVVVVLAGKYAGKKAIIVKAFDKGTDDRQFGHSAVVGIDRYPRKVTKGMSKKKTAKRMKLKPFVKLVNFNHIMPTRYQISDLDLKKSLKNQLITQVIEEHGKKVEYLKSVKIILETRYQDQNASRTSKNKDGAKYFFKKLRF